MRYRIAFLLGTAVITVAACNPDRSRDAFKSYQPTLLGGDGDPAEFEAHLTECRYDGLMIVEMQGALVWPGYGARQFIDACLAARGYQVADDWKDNPAWTTPTQTPRDW